MRIFFFLVLVDLEDMVRSMRRNQALDGVFLLGLAQYLDGAYLLQRCPRNTLLLRQC